MHIQHMTDEVVGWMDGHIPFNQRDPMNTCIKLTEEVSELMHAIHTGDGNAAEECADVLILLLDVAALTGADIANAFNAKMLINKGRTWKLKNGALKHT